MTARTLTLLAAAGLGMLAACSTVTPPVAAESAVPARWDAQAEAVAHTPTAVAWWTSFQDTQLDSLVARGLGQGLDLRMAKARLEQARGLAQATGGGRYPTLGLGVDVSQASAGTGSSKRTASLRGSWTVDAWGANEARAQSADSAAEAAGFDLETTRQTLVASIATSYLQVLAVDERIALASRIADDAQGLLGLVEKQAALGAASQLDVAQQRSTLQGFQAAIPALQLQRAALLGQLAVLVDAPAQGFSMLPRPLMQVAVPPVALISPADAVAARAEVRAALARLQAANFDLDVARAAFLPTFTLSAQAGWQWQPSAALLNLAGSALQTLFDGGQREGQLRVGRARAEELASGYRQAVLRVLQETEAQRVAVQRHHESERLGEATVASAREALRLSRIRFEHGASDLLAVIVNERTLYQAQDALLQTRLQRLLAVIGLYRAMGGHAPLAVAVSAPSSPPLASARPASLP